jgi:hypothetical protein
MCSLVANIRPAIQNSCDAITAPKYMEMIAKTREDIIFPQIGFLLTSSLTCLSFTVAIKVKLARKSQTREKPNIIL